jgi:hypothetical protein
MIPCSRIIVKRIIFQLNLKIDCCIHQKPPPVSILSLKSADQVLPFSFLKDTDTVSSHVFLGLVGSFFQISSHTAMYFCSLLHIPQAPFISSSFIRSPEGNVTRRKQIFPSNLAWNGSVEKYRSRAIPVFYFAGPVCRRVRRITKSDH